MIIDTDSSFINPSVTSMSLPIDDIYKYTKRYNSWSAEPSNNDEAGIYIVNV